MTPAERSLRARMAAYRLHATHDPKETTAAARAAFLARFEREVDPDCAFLQVSGGGGPRRLAKRISPSSRFSQFEVGNAPAEEELSPDDGLSVRRLSVPSQRPSMTR